jgi:hypothetical protein
MTRYSSAAASFGVAPGCTLCDVPATLAALASSVVLLVGFVVVEKWVRHPLVPLGIFRSRVLLGANLIALTLTAATTPPMLCTLYVQQVLGYPPAEAGLVFPPFNLAAIGLITVPGDVQGRPHRNPHPGTSAHLGVRVAVEGESLLRGAVYWFPGGASGKDPAREWRLLRCEEGA